MRVGQSGEAACPARTLLSPTLNEYLPWILYFSSYSCCRAALGRLDEEERAVSGVDCKCFPMRVG